MKTVKNVFYSFLCFASVCCGQQNRKDLSDCVQYNNQAVKALMDFEQNGRDTTNLFRSLEFYDKAIKCNPSNVINYQGKLTIVNILGRFKEALKLNDKLYELSRKTDIHSLISKAVIYERLGSIDSSRVYFHRAFDSYDKQLKQHPPDSMRIICDRLYLTAITKGKNIAIEKLKSYLVKYPNDSTLKLYEEIMRDFDRKAIIPTGR